MTSQIFSDSTLQQNTVEKEDKLHLCLLKNQPNNFSKEEKKKTTTKQ